MGSKNLKAIAVKGKNRLEVKNLEKFLELSNYLTELISTHEPNKVLSKFGTSHQVLVMNSQGVLPTRNFNAGVFEGAEKISGEKMAQTILKSSEGCYACAGGCKRGVEILSGSYQISPIYAGPEYETLAALGSLLGIDDLAAISKGNELCNRYTLDSISTGAVIAFAMECYENGLLTLEDTEGVEFNFGNANAMLKAIEWIAFRKKGLGDILADGVKGAAGKIGRGAEKFALHVKGQELPMHDPRGKAGMVLALAISPTGADHMEVIHDPPFSIPGPFLDRIAPLGLLETVPSKDLGPQKVRNYIYLQILGSLYHSLGVCQFSAGPVWALPLNKLVEVVNAITGWETSLWELLKVGERAIHMSRVFNIREGFGCRDDLLPDRLFQPLESGPLMGKGIDRREFAEALKMYYEAMGWEAKEGVPTRGKLAELNLSWLDEYLQEKRPPKK
jgi:aldehyde:ferredoxin oxidoreductase